MVHQSFGYRATHTCGCDVGTEHGIDQRALSHAGLSENTQIEATERAVGGVQFLAEECFDGIRCQIFVAHATRVRPEFISWVTVEGVE